MGPDGRAVGEGLVARVHVRREMKFCAYSVPINTAVFIGEGVKVKVSAVVHREGRWFVAWCPELDVASQGRTVEDSLTHLREALELRLEDEAVELPAEPFLLTTVEVERASTPRTPRP